jgi:hypothetical protein
MAKPSLTVLEHNATTGEIIERPMTQAEITQAAADAKEASDTKAALEAKKQEVLAKLGLTADEVSALLA